MLSLVLGDDEVDDSDDDDDVDDSDDDDDGDDDVEDSDDDDDDGDDELSSVIVSRPGAHGLSAHVAFAKNVAPAMHLHWSAVKSTHMLKCWQPTSLIVDDVRTECGPVWRQQ